MTDKLMFQHILEYAQTSKVDVSSQDALGKIANRTFNFRILLANKKTNCLT